MLVFCFASQIQSQSLLFPSDYFFDIQRQQQVLADTSPVHSSLHPFDYTAYETHDSLLYYKENRSLFSKKLVYDNLLKLDVNDSFAGSTTRFKLSIDPLFNFQGGMDLADSAHKKLYTNTRGLLVKGGLNNKIKFETAFFENQSTFPTYINNFVLNDSVVPGQGRYKNFKTTGYDYAFASGVISYSPCQNFNLQFGHGKQKIGNGYRSLLLSDNSFNYPFARMGAKFFKGKVQYTVIYAALTNLNSGTKTPFSEKLFQKKAASFQYLSWQLHRSLNISFFQGMMWQAGDNKNQQHIDAGFINPVIFTNAALYGLNNKTNNIVVGGDVQFKINKTLALYAQWMLDDMKPADGYSNSGIQAGIKYFDAFSLRNLFIQTEFNRLNNQPYSLAGTGLLYSHYNQNIAYPLTYANGNEAILISSYNYKRVFASYKLNYFIANNPQDSKYTMLFHDARLSYLIHPKTNMNLCMGMNWRTSSQQNIATNSPEQNSETRFFYISLRTSLYNVYWDF